GDCHRARPAGGYVNAATASPRRKNTTQSKNLLSLLPVGLHAHTRPPRRAHFHVERRLKNLLQQFPLVHRAGRPHTQTFTALNQHHLVRVFRRQIQFVRHHHHGVAIPQRQPPQPVQQIHLRGNIQVQRRLIQQQQQRL